MTYENIKKLKAEEFKRLCGVRIETFNRMVELVRNYEKFKNRSGRPAKISIENQVLITLEYLREYRTYFHIGQTWGVNESTVFRIVRKVEDILIKAKEFRLPGKKQLLNKDIERELVVIDVTEIPRERPKKKQKSSYSGKKRRHTMKAQVITDRKTRKIICTAYAQGKEHDFKLYKRSKIRINSKTKIIGDKGYQGIHKIHANSQVPHKKPRKKKLDKVQKKQNRELAMKRIIVENIYRELKIFRILSERYRNRGKRFSLRFNLIAAIHNYELCLL
ncbi:MAG: IS5 family transposase [Waterburya sp.]